MRGQGRYSLIGATESPYHRGPRRCGRGERATMRECLEETGGQCLSFRLSINYHMSLDPIHNPTYILLGGYRRVRIFVTSTPTRD
jgi:hypothetical protein